MRTLRLIAPRRQQTGPVFRFRSKNVSGLYTPNLQSQWRSVFSFLSLVTQDQQRITRCEQNPVMQSTTAHRDETRLSMPSRQQMMPHFARKRLTEPFQRHETALIDLPIDVRDLTTRPIGSFRPSTWRQVQRYLVHFQKRNDIHPAFQLLDRAAQEPDTRIRITNDMVYPVVHAWLMLYIRQQQKYFGARSKSRRNRAPSFDRIRHKHDHPQTLSPLDVWRKVEAYQRRQVPLESSVFQMVIEGTAHVKAPNPDHPSGPLLAETVLEAMISESERNNPLLRPSVSSFRGVLSSWEQAASFSSEVAMSHAPDRALAILQKLKTLYDSGWGSELLPDKMCFYKVMNLFAHVGDGDQVEELLEDLYTLYLDHGENRYDLRPTSPFFSLVLYAWSKSRDPSAAERAEIILDRMLDLESSGKIRGLKVSAAFFNIVMVCWRRHRTTEAVAKVQTIFDRMTALSEKDADKAPTGGSFIALITSWAHHDPYKVEDIFRCWQEAHQRGCCDMRFDSELLHTLVDAWYNSNDPARVQRCYALVQEAIESSHPNFKPTTRIFNMAVSACCATHTVAWIQRAEELLLQMEKCGASSSPSVSTYRSIVQAWVILGDIERAEDLLMDCLMRVEETDVVFENRDENLTGSITQENTRIWRTDTSKTPLLNIVLKGWLSRAALAPEAGSRAEQL